LVLDFPTLSRLPLWRACQIRARLHGSMRELMVNCGATICNVAAHRPATVTLIARPFFQAGGAGSIPVTRSHTNGQVRSYLPDLGFADCGSASRARFVPDSCLPLLRGHFLVSTGGSAVRAGVDRDNHRLSGRCWAWSHADQPIQGC
jgi:hypothetical protein